jgi:voltage-gated potassium channel
MTEEHRDRLASYEARTTIPLVSLALAFLALYAVPILWQELPRGLDLVIQVLSFLVWFVFVVDLGMRAYLSGRPWAYLVRHPIDFILVALPMLRPLRVLRVFTAANFLVTRGGKFAVGRTVASALVGAAFLMFIAALAVLDAERGQPGANIETFGSSLWWAGVTITTVGYGDVYPVTPTGRLAAFALMLVGISLLGLITASVAAWFVSKTRAGDDEVLAELRALRAEITAMRAERDDPQR